MPPRRRQRQASSDIEEGATQDTVRDEVDDDEEEKPARGGKLVRKPTQPDGAADGDDDEDDDPIDVENFPDYPLVENDVLKLKGLANDWSQLISSVMTNVGAVGDVGALLLEHGDPNDKEKWTNEVDSIFKEFIDVEARMTMHATALDDIRQTIAQGDTVVDIIPRYNAAVTKKETDYQQKTSRQKYIKHEKYKDFRERLWEAGESEVAMPPISELIPAEEGDESDDDDEVEIGGVTTDYKCPITLRVLENPVKSASCGHYYSQNAIKEMFGNQPNVLKACPASGCHQKIKLSECLLDKEFAKRIKEHQRRQKRREEEMEVDEVIE